MGGSGHRVVDAIGSMDYQVHVADVVGEGGEGILHGCESHGVDILFRGRLRAGAYSGALKDPVCIQTVHIFKIVIVDSLRGHVAAHRVDIHADIVFVAIL